MNNDNKPLPGAVLKPTAPVYSDVELAEVSYVNPEVFGVEGKTQELMMRNEDIRFPDVQSDDFEFPQEAKTDPTKELPFFAPNATKLEDIRLTINGPRYSKGPKKAAMVLTSLLGAPALYYLTKTVRINDGFVGVSSDNGTPHFLMPGMHNLASPLHTFQQEFSVGQKIIKSGPISIIQVDEGRLGLAWNDGKPQLLLPGRHVRNSNNFEYVQDVSVTDRKIVFGPVTIFRVFEDEYGLAWNGEKAEIYRTGWYVRNSPYFKLSKCVKIKEQLIQFGPICIFRVMDGELAFGWNGENPEVYTAGVYFKNNADFKYVSKVQIDQTLINMGPIKIVTVDAGEERVCYDNGKLVLLSEGRYYRNSGTFVVGHSINLRQQTLNFEKHKVLAQGGVYLVVEGLLTFQISDSRKFVLELGDRDLIRAIKDVTKSEIANVFSSVFLEQVNQAAETTLEKSHGKAKKPEPRGLLSQKDDAKSSSDSEPPSYTGETDDKKADSQFRNHIIEDITKNICAVIAGWGINVIAFQLKSIELANESYAEEYEKASLELATAEVERRAIDAKKDITIQRAEAEAEAALTTARGKGAEMEAMAEAERNVAKIRAYAKRDTLTIEAKAEADAVRIKAEASNNAAEIMSDPFAKQLRMMPEYAALLSKHPHRNALVINGDGGSSSGNNGGGMGGGDDLLKNLMTFSILKDFNMNGLVQSDKKEQVTKSKFDKVDIVSVVEPEHKEATERKYL